MSSLSTAISTSKKKREKKNIPIFFFFRWYFSTNRLDPPWRPAGASQVNASLFNEKRESHGAVNSAIKGWKAKGKSTTVSKGLWCTRSVYGAEAAAAANSSSSIVPSFKLGKNVDRKEPKPVLNYGPLYSLALVSLSVLADSDSARDKVKRNLSPSLLIKNELCCRVSSPFFYTNICLYVCLSTKKKVTGNI